MNESHTMKQIRRGIALICVLSVCLCFTSFALVYSVVTVENNLFQTGQVKINLNDGKPVIDELNVEPGMTLYRDFFLENQGSCDVYYKLYFQNVSGDLKDVLQVTIRDGDRVLAKGTAATLSGQTVSAVDDVLRLGEKRDLQIWFYYPPAAGNDTENTFLHFDLAAEAVQVQNNPQKEF